MTAALSVHPIVALPRHRTKSSPHPTLAMTMVAVMTILPATIPPPPPPSPSLPHQSKYTMVGLAVTPSPLPPATNESTNPSSSSMVSHSKSDLYCAQEATLEEQWSSPSALQLPPRTREIGDQPKASAETNRFGCYEKDQRQHTRAKPRSRVKNDNVKRVMNLDCRAANTCIRIRLTTIGRPVHSSSTAPSAIPNCAFMMA